MKRWRRLFQFVGLSSVLIIAFLAWSGDGFFGGAEVCTTCGRIKSSSRIFWIQSSKVKETELSQFYDKHKGDMGHRHTWLFASGSGGSTTCAIGNARHLYSAILSNELPHALELIRQKRGSEAADAWLERLLDPESSNIAYSILITLLDDTAAFDASYRRAEALWDYSTNNDRRQMSSVIAAFNPPPEVYSRQMAPLLIVRL